MSNVFYITSLKHHGISNHCQISSLFNSLFKLTKNINDLHCSPFVMGNPPAGGFPSQRASNVTSISVWWHQHDLCLFAITSHQSIHHVIFTPIKWSTPRSILQSTCKHDRSTPPHVITRVLMSDLPSKWQCLLTQEDCFQTKFLNLMAIWKPTIIKNVDVKYIIWLTPIALILKCIILCLERFYSDSKSTLLQVMAWCHQLTSHYLKECSAMHDLQWHMKGLVQDCSNSIANTME